jgi:hypothetical protein
MADVCAGASEAGVEAVAFGDLFLRDIRAYREQQLRGTRLEPLFPLWNLDTRILARDMIAAGLRAKVTCVDPKRLVPGFAGRDFDQQFLDDLPPGVDPCGENGEFHSFAYLLLGLWQNDSGRMGELSQEMVLYSPMFFRRSGSRQKICKFQLNLITPLVY